MATAHPVEARLRAQPQELDAVMRQGWAMWSAGQQAAAIDAWQAAAAAMPRAVPPRMALANAARVQGQPARRRALLESVLADDPGHVAAQHEMVRCLMADGDWAAARARLDPLLAARPRHGGLLIDHATMLRREGASQAAEAALAAVPAQDPQAIPAQLALGRLLRERGATEEALATFEAARARAHDPIAVRAESARTLLDADRAAEALAMLSPAAGDTPDTRLTLLAAEALRLLGRRDEALARLEAAPADPSILVQRLIDQAALQRPERFRARAAPGPAESGKAMAALLKEASGAELSRHLARIGQQAHPFTVIGTAEALLAQRADPESRLAAALAAAHAFGAMGARYSAVACLDRLAAESPALPAALAAQFASRRGSALLVSGNREAAAGHFAAARALAPSAAEEAPGLLTVLEAGPDSAPAEDCLALLAPGAAPVRLRAWLADRAAALLSPDDPRLALPGLPYAERAMTEVLLRHNVAVAQGDRAAARRLLAGLFEPQGLGCPQPDGAPPGMAHFACPTPPAVDGPLVSVVISAHDAAETLPLSLSSVLAQSWRNLEVLVVDDASSDDTAAIIDGFAARDPRVRPLGARQNGGTYACRNLAIGVARGGFITFHDADDWMHPQRIAIEMEAFAKPSVLAVNSRWFRMDEAGRVRFLPRANPVHANPSFMLFRMDTLRRLGCYDGVRASADTEMLWRARMVLGPDAIAMLPQLLTIGAARTDSLTTNSATGMDLFGFNALRAAYHEAYIGWHRSCDAAGVVPFLAPGAAAPYAGRLPAAMLAGPV